jgi:integrase
MKLRERDIAALTLPRGKKDKIYFDDDLGGFALRLRDGGSSAWIFQYRIGKRQRRLTFGSLSSMSAAKAREQATKFYAAVKLGRDPAGEKNTAKTLANETIGVTLPLFLARQKERLRPRAYIEVERHLNSHAKRLHGLPLANVTRRDVAGVLTALAGGKSGATANRVRSSLSGFFSWAIAEGLIDNNPVAWTERREEVSRARVLTDAELREIWAALKDDAYGDILRLLLLTGARREEVGGLRRSEMDLGRALITLPPERVKNKREHIIPLTAPTLAILKARAPLIYDDGSSCDLVFGRGKRGFADWQGSKADLDERIEAVRKAAGQATMPKWVVHDFRRTLSTVMHDRLSIAPHIVEAILNHIGHKAGVAGTYNRAGYEDAKRVALHKWADHLETVVSGKPSVVVVKLRSA